jgi:cytochrome c553
MFFSNNFISHKMVFLWLVLISTTVVSGELVQRNNKAEREKAAQQVTQQFVKQLGGHLKKEMKAGGPVAAIKVCKEIAPKLANDLSRENGWRVTRVTTKPRNTLLGSADLWESKTLVEFESRAAKGEKYSNMTQVEIVEEAGTSYFRYMKPLAVKPICLTCHGSNEQIPPSVKAALDTAYPFDQAKNYKVGELRGAVSIKQAMAIPLSEHTK